MKSIKKTNITVVILCAIAALFTGVFVAQHVHFNKKIDPARFHGTYLTNPRPINAFSLTGTDGQPFNNEHLKGKWTMMFFGFTSCSSVCPITMAELSKMYRLLESKNIKDMPNIIMVSVDPERDTLEKLGQYVQSFQPHFYGARGSEEQVRAMTDEMGIVFTRIQNKENDATHYEIEHSGAIMLFNPQGELNAFFTTPHHAQLLAKDYLLLVS